MGEQLPKNDLLKPIKHREMNIIYWQAIINKSKENPDNHKTYKYKQIIVPKTILNNPSTKNHQKSTSTKYLTFWYLT